MFRGVKSIYLKKVREIEREERKREKGEREFFPDFSEARPRPLPLPQAAHCRKIGHLTLTR